MEYGMFGNSECSSGCESGWTVYLENSIIAPYSSYKGSKFRQGKAQVNGQEEEEDLSMVSDASSGPPQILAEEDYGNDSHGWCYHAPVGAVHTALAKSNVKRQKKKESRHQNLKEKPSMLDDTASSPIFNCTNNNFTINNNQTSLENVVPDFSQGYSTTQFQGQSAYQEHCEYFQSSLLPANQLQQNQWFEGRRWG